MHANFIVNLGHATAEEISDLIELVQTTVTKHHGIHLHPEVKRLGFPEATPL
jgi:UDP-N-acetylmuramate dehydrogenase